MAHNDPLSEALMAAALELAKDHDWSFGDQGEARPEPDGEFISVMRKHLHPLLDTAAYIAARREALRAELAALGGE